MSAEEDNVRTSANTMSKQCSSRALQSSPGLYLDYLLPRIATFRSRLLYRPSDEFHIILRNIWVPLDPFPLFSQDLTSVRAHVLPLIILIADLRPASFFLIHLIVLANNSVWQQSTSDYHQLYLSAMTK